VLHHHLVLIKLVHLMLLYDIPLPA